MRHPAVRCTCITQTCTMHHISKLHSHGILWKSHGIYECEQQHNNVLRIYVVFGHVAPVSIKTHGIPMVHHMERTWKTDGL